MLGPAIASAEVVNLSTITNEDDPREYLREHMKVEIVKDAYLIRVALELADRNQAAAIVNAVVHSYLQYNGEHQRSGNSTLRKSLADQLEKYKNSDRREARRAKKDLYRKARSALTRQIPIGRRTAAIARTTDVTAVSEEQSDRLAGQMLDTRLEIIKVESDLKTREDAKQLSEEEQRQLAVVSDKEREQQIQEEFQKRSRSNCPVRRHRGGGRATRACQKQWRGRAMTRLAKWPNRNTRS